MDDAPEPGDRPAVPAWRAALSGKAILVCVAIALVGAVVAGAIAYAMADKDDDTAATSTSVPKGTLTPAKKVPATTFTRFDGSPTSLTDFKGQKLIVNFFASSCGPCKKEMPTLDKISRQLGDEVSVVGIAVQDDPTAAQALIKATKVAYDVGQDPDGKLFYELTGATTLPATVFIAADGTVMDVHFGALSEAKLKDEVSTNLLAGG